MVFAVSLLGLLTLPLPRWILYPLAAIPPIVATPTFMNIVRNAARDDAEHRVWWSERVRGLRAGEDIDGDGDVETEERMRESAEWANNLLSGVWPIMNPSLFDSMVDMLEDIMQGSMPTFVVSPLIVGRCHLLTFSCTAQRACLRPRLGQVTPTDHLCSCTPRFVER